MLMALDARRHSASGFPLVSAGLCWRALDHIVWSGIPTPENAGKGNRPCFRSSTPGPSCSRRLALPDRSPAANWRVRLFLICCSSHLRPRSFLFRESPPLDWFEVVAAASDNRNECHSLCISQRFLATSLQRRSNVVAYFPFTAMTSGAFLLQLAAWAQGFATQIRLALSANQMSQ